MMTEATELTVETDIALKMATILGTMMLILIGLALVQTTNHSTSTCFLACQQSEPSKRAYEQWVMLYTPIWILAFAVIVAFQLYEDFTAASYMTVCAGLALPFLLQPIIYPSAGFNSPDQWRPWYKRYSFKANIWLAVYSFIGNYYYTHYFYSVLKAKYTMPAHRLNNVPFALYFATHFYFSTYHLFSNILLRLVETKFAPSIARNILFWAVVLVFSYFTAFMETLTISSYPYYSFEDRDAAYRLGSAFYGIYFIVSFPAFYFFDREIDNELNGELVVNGNARVGAVLPVRQITVWDTVVSSCGYGMIILTLLDFVRLNLNIPLVMDISSNGDGTCDASL